MTVQTSLSDQAAEEIRALLARRNMTKSALARRLRVSHTWVTNRLTGQQEIGVNELGRIAEALDVPVIDLLPASARKEVTAVPGVNPRNPALPGRPTRPATPAPDHRPTGRAPVCNSPTHSGKRPRLLRAPANAA